jgi:hypothetical protein
VSILPLLPASDYSDAALKAAGGKANGTLEFFAQDTDGVTQNNTYTYLYDNGYNGAWAWSYNADQKWPTMQVPMQNVYSAHTATVGGCP